MRDTSRAAVMLRLVLPLVVALAAAALAPAEARAQFGQSSDYCADQSPYAGVPAPTDPRTTLEIKVEGAGSVTPYMYNTAADCITPIPPASRTCSGGVCRYEVQTVCHFHCYSHKHMPPQHWNVRLVPSDAGFLGWSGDACRPVPSAAYSRRECLLLMTEDHAVTATFGAPDTTAPAGQPTVSLTPTSFSMRIAWTPSSDQFLAGYEIWLNGALLTRQPRDTTSYTALNLLCESSYSVRVVAFDAWNETSSAETPTRTGACRAAAQPRPQTVIHVKPRRTTRSRTAFFHFGYRGDIRATKYQCKLDRGRWARCSGRNGKRYRNLRKGVHTFSVRAGNAAGYDRTPARWRFRIR